MATKIAELNSEDNSLQEYIQNVFQESQTSASSHRRLVRTLRKVLDRADELDEVTEFFNEFARCVAFVLPLRKAEQCAEKVVRFVTLFVKNCQLAEDEAPNPAYAQITDDLLAFLIHGVNAKLKNVRFRSIQLIACIVSTLNEIEDSLSRVLASELIDRLQDKEATIRVQSVLALSRLQIDISEEEDDEDYDNELGRLVTDKLLTLLYSDPSPEVRRAVLLNLIRTKQTLPYLLERARDESDLNRKWVFTRVLRQIPDFRMLSITMREKVLKWGLTDRDSGVKDTAVKLLANNWMENVDGDLMELLERLDVMNSEVPSLALAALFDLRPEIPTGIELPPEFWSELSVEGAFFAKCVCKYLHDKSIYSDVLPTLSQFAEMMESLLCTLNALDEDSPQAPEADFKLEQLLEIVENSDYSDEVGRRRILDVLRSILLSLSVSETLTRTCVRLYRKLSANDSDLALQISELFEELRERYLEPLEMTRKRRLSEDNDNPNDDSGMESDDSFHSAVSSVPESEQSGEYKTQKLVIELRFLIIIQAMLEISGKSLQSNQHITNMLKNNIVPAIRNHDEIIRMKGLRCLGLCGTVDIELARMNLNTFLQCFEDGDEVLKIEALKVITDFVIIHGFDLASDRNEATDTVPSRVPTTKEDFIKKLEETLRSALVAQDMAMLQTVGCEAAGKLLLLQFIKSSSLLNFLLVLYFHPLTSKNIELRQCLGYCLPAFCYSRSENQEIFSETFVESFATIAVALEETPSEDDDLTLSKVAGQFIEWLDPAKCLSEEPSSVAGMNVGKDILRYLPSANATERKALASVLGKLPLSPKVSLEYLRDVYEKGSNLVELNVLKDSASTSAVKKFVDRLETMAGQGAEDLSGMMEESILNEVAEEMLDAI
ncbi:hypothetical protein CANCADRAFT_90069 [Tortispora caseinolytica NRRL Y-17796]|uniref:Nuclear condensin complex subunit 3 C-terminal domain-containing protein n=1 Tax=Tortispora caseinolytica NRRL Y-17796 TaxID=767744 RepID=A0A1E4TLN8_9ASCO|nr:hypothetical protein CANCADRAFT_90069 [Tortispora caseinolytica NRRL Y-17796]